MFFVRALLVVVRGWGKKPDPWWVHIYIYIWGKNYEKPVFCFQFSDVSWLWRWRIWRLKSFGYLWILMDQSPSEDVKQWEKQKDQVNACLESGLLGWAVAIQWVLWRPIKIISTHSKRPMNTWVFSWLASTRWKTIGWKPPKWRFRKLRSFSKRWFCTILDVICHGFFYLGSDCIKTHKSGYTRQVVSIDPKTVRFKSESSNSQPSGLQEPQ